MKRFSLLSSLLVAVFLTSILVGSAINGTLDERQRRDTEQALANDPVIQIDKCEPAGTVRSEPAVLSPAEEALIEEMKEARKAGDQVRVDEILSILSPGEERSSGTPPAIHPEVTFVGEETEQGGRGSLDFGNDVLLADNPAITEGHPDMVSSSSGKYFLVLESMNNTTIRVYRSFDGGNSWSWYLVFTGTSEILDPAITVPELDEDFLYVIYEYANQIQVAKVDLITNETTYHNVESTAPLPWLHRPRIVTDNIDWPGNYWLYVTYVRGSLGDRQDLYQVIVARSLDEGATWESFQTLYSSLDADPVPRPDIAYGGSNLYATWAEELWTGEIDVHVSRSTNLGSSWEPSVNLTGTPTNDCYDPRVAAIQDGDEAVVVYTYLYSATDTDIYYAYTVNGGSTWNTNYVLHNPGTEEERPDICVDPSLGDFHVTFWKEFNTMYTHTPYSNPTAWSSPVVVDDASSVSRDYYPPTVAVDWTSGEAGVAWSDFRTPTYAIYFDRADWAPLPPLQVLIQPQNGQVFQPGQWIQYAVWLTNNTSSPIHVTASTYGTNIPAWRRQLEGPITFWLPGQTTKGPIYRQAQIPWGAPPMTAYVCIEAEPPYVNDCYQVTIQ